MRMLSHIPAVTADLAGQPLEEEADESYAHAVTLARSRAEALDRIEDDHPVD